VRAQGLTDKRALRVQTRNALIEPRLQADGEVTVTMGSPRFAPAQVPFDAAGLVPRRVGGADLWPLEVDGALREIVVLSMGNPHAVQVVADVDAAPVATEGPRIERHARFPQRVNAGFMQVLDRHTIGLRVWERGAGETLACGTGACAAAVAGIVQGLLDSPVTVQARGGRLTIAWNGAGDATAAPAQSAATVDMTGPAVTVFEGEIEL
jgi:diaminopimelate epimerase